ncbi:MAG: hypothetical protein EXR54_07085 [Dehalococcoidia bacterium]|nr:hypothetical protein [Dehalococcoidia bacterium]MSQ17314.1 hypothetical protein [Dehalococcoidia bacterium]
MKVRAVGVAVVALMTVSTLGGAGILVYQAASGQAAETSLSSPALHEQPELPATPASGQAGDNVAVSAFKLVCPFH